jgi:hypothetical protein
MFQDFRRIQNISLDTNLQIKISLYIFFFKY